MGLLGIFSAFGLSASAGLNAYLPLLVVALLAKFTNLIVLKSPWDTLTSWWIIGLLFVLSSVEFVVDKVPVVNHINDAVQTFIRPVAGAILFAASANVITNINPVLSLAIGLLVSGSVHVVKSAAVRPAISAATAGSANIPVSLLEDLTSTLVSILSVVVPVLVACILIPLISYVIWWFWRRARRREKASA